MDLIIDQNHFSKAGFNPSTIVALLSAYLQLQILACVKIWGFVYPISINDAEIMVWMQMKIEASYGTQPMVSYVNS